MKRLVAEALELEPDALDKFFHDPPRNKVSLLKYPPPPQSQNAGTQNRIHGLRNNGESGEPNFQGVGSHKDGGFLTYLLQATPHAGLEAQNKAGDWIPIPPIDDTLVINVGRSLEAITGGVCTATTHRVSLRPQDFIDQHGRPRGPRFSYPVFQTLKLDIMHEELCSLKLPDHIRNLVQDEKVKSDAEAFFAQYHLMSPGQGIFTARLTSHPDVGRKWYPELLEAALKGQKEFQS
jgi:isopenicillin N synthase-like dioxygenase